MTRRSLAAVLAAACGLILPGCSLLTAFNTLAPRDPAIRAGRDIAYGSDPRQTAGRLYSEDPRRWAGKAPILAEVTDFLQRQAAR